jgi:hypothetical protein
MHDRYRNSDCVDRNEGYSLFFSRLLQLYPPHPSLQLYPRSHYPEFDHSIGFSKGSWVTNA